MSTPIDRYHIVLPCSLIGGIGGGLVAYLDCGDARALAGGAIGYFIGVLVGALTRWSLGLIYLLTSPPLAEPESIASVPARRVGGVLGRLIGSFICVVVLHELHWVLNLANLLNVGFEVAAELHRAEAIAAANALAAIAGGNPRPANDVGEAPASPDRRTSVFSARPLRWLIRDQGHAIIETMSQVRQIAQERKADHSVIASWRSSIREYPEAEGLTQRQIDELDPHQIGVIVAAHLAVAETRSVLRRTWIVRHIPAINTMLESLEKDWHARKKM